MSIDFTGVTLPFSAADLLKSGVGLLTVVGPFVLLAIAFPMLTKLVGAIKSAFSKGKAA
ncbi:MAG: hypothetical protein Q8934_15555 [Bacillota bacterium]|nr:hypothetical protein [Bacillota bacterium]